MTPIRSQSRLQTLGLRLRTAVAAGVLLLALLAVAGRLRVDAAVPKPRAMRASLEATDSVIIYGPQQFTKYGTPTQWTIYDDMFEADTLAGWRYELQVVNDRITQGTIAVGERQFVGTSELGLTVAGLIRRIDVAEGSNSIDIALKGASGASLTVKVVRKRDPQFRVFGPQEHVRPATIAAQKDSFTLPADATTPHTLWVLNGSPNGTNRVTNATLHLNGAQVLSASDFGSGKATITRDVSLQAGPNGDSLYNQSASGTRLTLSYFATDATAPEIALAAPFDTTDTLFTRTSGVRVSGTVTDSIAGLLKVNTGANLLTPGAFTDSIPLPADGTYPITVYARNSAKLETVVQRVVVRDATPCSLWVRAFPADTVGDTLRIQGSWADASHTTIAIDGDIVATGTRGQFSIDYPLDVGSNNIYIHALDVAGNDTSLVRAVFRYPALPSGRDSSSITPDPAAITAVTPFHQRIAFIYSGASPLQHGVIIDSLVPSRVAVVRGRVIARDWTGIGDDTVRVHSHPEYGYALTRNDGRFDFVVNGGGPLTIVFNMPGFLPIHRQVTPLPNTFCHLDDVALVGRTARFTVIDSARTRVARGRLARDANGERMATVVFPRGTSIAIAGPAGDTVTLATARVRAVEYTIGQGGAVAMPAPLPPTTAYTYCVDLRLDEADSLASSSDGPGPSVAFSTPVPVYVRGVAHAPVGSRVPVGYYDAQECVWKAMDDGVVCRVVSVDSQGAPDSIDTRGSGYGDSQARLDSLGITAEELKALRGLYAVGDTVWRIRTKHFSIIDCNFNRQNYEEALSGASRGREHRPPLVEDDCHYPGSIIGCDDRTLGQSIPIVGTELSLEYRSFRAQGDMAIRSVRVPIVGTEIPVGLRRIIVRLDVAGKRYEQSLFGPFTLGMEPVTIQWDGKDAYGQRVNGAVDAELAVGYEFSFTYATSPYDNLTTTFGTPSGRTGASIPTTGDRDLGQVAWNKQKISLGAPTAASDGLGGWTLSTHHLYDATGQGVVYRGDGSILRGDARGSVAVPMSSPLCDGSSSGQAPSMRVRVGALAAGPDGSLYVADNCRGAVFRVDQSGTYRQIAGKNAPGDYDGDGPALETHLRDLTGLAVGPDGTIYFSMGTWSNRPKSVVGRISPSGLASKIVGGSSTNTATGGGDGGPVTDAWIAEPKAIALGPDGSLFIADVGDHDNRVRRVRPDGLIDTYAGNGTDQSSASDGPARGTGIGSLGAIATDAAGVLYIADGYSLKTVTPDGWMRTSGNQGKRITALATDLRGALYAATTTSVYICQNPGNYIEKREPGGAFSVIAGGKLVAHPSAPLPPHMMSFCWPKAIAVAPDGTYYFDNGGSPLYKVAGASAADDGGTITVPSRDGAELYVFASDSDNPGQHLYTRDALTGSIRHRFEYDSENRLMRLYDGRGLCTQVLRAADGSPLALLAPNGMRTRVTVDAHGHLASVIDSAGNAMRIETDANGLLRAFIDASSTRSEYDYGTDGRLLEARGPASVGGHQRLDVSYDGGTRTVSRSTVEGRVTKYSLTARASAAERVVITPDGLRASVLDSIGARVIAESPDGVVQTDSIVPDPRFGMMAPFAARMTTRLPSGMSRVIDVARSMPQGFAPPHTRGTWSELRALNGMPPRSSSFNADSLIVRHRSAAGRVWATALDSAGRPRVAFQSGRDSIRVAYDSEGRISHWQMGERALEVEYENAGARVRISDSLGASVVRSYDTSRRLIEFITPDSTSHELVRDADGRVREIIVADRSVHRFTYAESGELIGYEPAGEADGDGSIAYGYDRDGVLTKVVFVNDDSLHLDYAAGGLQLMRTQCAQSGVQYEYYAGGTTGGGRLREARTQSGIVTTYTYDGPLVASKVYSGAVAGLVETKYDRQLDPIEEKVGDSDPVHASYDADGLLVQVGIESILRKPDSGDVDSVQFVGFGVSGSREYNTYGEVSAIHMYWPGGGFYQGLMRDGAGRVRHLDEIWLADTARSFEYEYDSRGRLGMVYRDGNLTRTAQHDRWGNIRESQAWSDTGMTMRRDSCDVQDRLLQYGTVRCEYTPSGRLQYKIAPVSEWGSGGLGVPEVDAETTAYMYDSFGALLWVRRASGDTVYYLYDADGRRVSRAVGDSTTHRWVYDVRGRLVAECREDGAVEKRFVYGTREYVPDYMHWRDSVYAVVSDWRGSVRAVVNARTGALVQRLEYDEWGRVLSNVGEVVQPFGFSGGLWDQATGLLRLGARDYDPEAGRWTAKEPLGVASGTTNLYAYAFGDPVNLMDINGLLTLPVGPGGLPPGWERDFTHRAPNDEVYKNPKCPDHWLEWHKGMEGEPGWKGKDHWHYSHYPDGDKENEHLPPGRDVELPDGTDFPDGGPPYVPTKYGIRWPYTIVFIPSLYWTDMGRYVGRHVPGYGGGMY